MRLIITVLTIVIFASTPAFAKAKSKSKAKPKAKAKIAAKAQVKKTVSQPAQKPEPAPVAVKAPEPELGVELLPAVGACGPKTKAKIAALEKKSDAFAVQASAFSSKHKPESDGRMPASFCKDKKNGMESAAHLAKSGFPMSEELEAIERNNSGECSGMANRVRLKVEQIFMDLNNSFIKTCVDIANF